MAALDVVTPTGLGKQMKAAIGANRDGVTDTVRAAMGGGVLTTGSAATPVRVKMFGTFRPLRKCGKRCWSRCCWEAG